jgi:hypothetical protein
LTRGHMLGVRACRGHAPGCTPPPTHTWRTSLAPMFSTGSSSSTSLAMVTPAFTILGEPYFDSRTTLRPCAGAECECSGVKQRYSAAFANLGWATGLAYATSPC